MTRTNLPHPHMDQRSTDAEVWQGLKRAIASSSGFKSWRSERNESTTEQTADDQQIRSYLRETLETLAY